MEIKSGSNKSMKSQFMEGLILQITNPKAVFFFMSIFPQFVDFTTDYKGTFTLLVVTYSSLVLFIHMTYAYLAKSARGWLSTAKGGRIVNRLGGATFMCFGIGLVSTNK
jgi:threonine/homoserine/homoserine lactone efflux protein